VACLKNPKKLLTKKKNKREGGGHSETKKKNKCWDAFLLKRGGGAKTGRGDKRFKAQQLDIWRALKWKRKTRKNEKGGGKRRGKIEQGTKNE